MSYRTVLYLIRHQSCLCGTVQRKFSVTTSVSTNKLQTNLLSESRIIDGKVEKKFKVRQNKKQKPVISVYKNMSVEAIATATKRDIDKVLDALDLSTNTYYKKNSKVADLKTIENAIKILGYRMKVVPNPHALIDRQENWQDTIRQPPPDPAELVKRPPVVTIMGHVDHGKTTLLDALRKSNIVAKEFGGITQHIGAFSVNLPSGDTITFLDTPGHAAFSAMRARGASVTDIIVLVVAADDGIMPQTIESIQHAANSNVPVIVAINKVDKPEADIESTEEMLLQYDLVSERLGGDVQCIPISALKGTNLQQLQDAVITLSEVMDLKGDLKGMVEGRVIDCKTLPGRGKVASIIIQRGTLKKGDMLIAGTGYAKVRSIINEKGVQLKKATLSMPVEVTGWRELPSAGDEILQCKSEKVLKVELDRRIAELSAQKVEKDSYVIEEKREKHNSEHQKELAIRYAKGLKTYMREKYSSYEKKKEEEIHHEGPSLAIILKGDVDGSVDAIMNTLNSYKSQMCRLSVISHGVGEVSLNDIETAKLFNGEIFTFNLPVSNTIIDLAVLNNIVIHQDNVIYRLFENLISSLTKQLPKLQEEEILGEANIIDIFYVSVKKKKVAVAGCRCTSGSLQKKHMMRLIRNDEEIYRGSVTSLKHFKNEVHSIQKGTDCGLSLSDMSVEFQRGDVIQCYRMMDVQQTLDWTPQF